MLGDLFVDSGSVKVLDYLLDLPGGEFSKTDLIKITGVSFSKMQKVIVPLESYGIIVKTRNISRATLYKVDDQNQILKILNKLDSILIRESPERRDVETREVQTASAQI